MSGMPGSAPGTRRSRADGGDEMVTIRYFPQENRVTVQGHAGSGEKGRDLVCSAVSALTYTLAENVNGLGGLAKDVVLRLTPGDAEISCRAEPEYRAVVQLIFDTIMTGYQLLGGKYPQYVAVKVFSEPV